MTCAMSSAATGRTRTRSLPIAASSNVPDEAYKRSKTPKHCKHIPVVQEYLKETEGGRKDEEGGMAVPLPSTPTLSKWIKRIHGKEFITYEGLLAMAHERGLQPMFKGRG